VGGATAPPPQEDFRVNPIVLLEELRKLHISIDELQESVDSIESRLIDCGYIREEIRLRLEPLQNKELQDESEDYTTPDCKE
jgi:hypothetical protein